MAGVTNGVFWKGADGKVYVSGNQGTNSAGNFDSNTVNYWAGQGYGMIDDPRGAGYSTRMAEQDFFDNNDPGIGGSSSSGGSGGSSAATSQIDQINRLLGVIDKQSRAGIGRLDSSYGETKRRLNEDKTQTFKRYDEQGVQNDQAKQRGVEQVDDFANTSYNSLQRLLQGANAGNSSVGRSLMPYLVSKGASTRRQGVFDTAGENARVIDQSRQEAEKDYGRAFVDTDNQYRDQKEDFMSNVEQQKMDLLAKRLAMQQEAGLATSATESELDRRATSLSSLFGKYAPRFNVATPQTKVRDLASYQLDPGQIKIGQNQGSGSYYANPIKKRQELEA
jgi:hypothetical protein